MKKLLLITLILFAGIESYAQVTKRNVVIKTSASQIVDVATYDENKNPSDHLFVFLGRNREYTQIIDMITIFSGDASEMLSFLSDLESFATNYKDDNEVSGDVQGHRVTHVKMYGMRVCYIHSSEKRGFMDIKDSDITKYKNKLIEYCEKNNIATN